MTGQVHMGSGARLSRATAGTEQRATRRPGKPAALGLAILAAALLATAGCGEDESPRPEQPERPAASDADDGAPTETPAASAEPDEPSRLSRQMLDAERWLAEEVLTASAMRQAAGRIRTAATQAVEEHQQDPATHVAAGDRALALGDYRAAAGCFRRALAIRPDHLDALQGLAIALTAEEEYDEATGVYRRILAAAKAREDSTAREAARTARFNLAVAEMRIGRTGAAKERLRELLAERDDPRARFNLASILQFEGKLTEASRQWRKALERADALPVADRVYAWASLGRAQLSLGEGEAAMDSYAQAAKLAPDDARVWSDLAAAARAAGSLGRAAAAARKAANLAPDDADAHNRLAGLLRELHRVSGRREHLDGAVAAWRESLRIDPDQPDVARNVETYSAP